MPETKCGDCEETFWGETREKVMAWELEHHKKSFKIAQEGSLAKLTGIDGFHDCRIFQEFEDATGLPIQMRIYNYNHLVETH